MTAEDEERRGFTDDFEVCNRVRQEGVTPIEDWVWGEIRRLTTDGCVARRAFDTFQDWLNDKGRYLIDCDDNWRAWLKNHIEWKTMDAVDWCKVPGRRGLEIDSERDGCHLEGNLEYQDLMRHCLDHMERSHRGALLLSLLGLNNLEIAKVLGINAADSSRLRRDARYQLGICVQGQLAGEDVP